MTASSSTWAPTWTRDPLPDDVDVLSWPRVCPTCSMYSLTLDHDPAPMTRSTEPDPGTGQYLIQPHQWWCPTWTGETPPVACPCGAPVDSYEYQPGYSLAVPDQHFGVGHLLGTADEILANPASRTVPFSKATPAPSFSKTTVSPCGHILEGETALRVVTRCAEIRAETRRAETDQTITDAQPLLQAAEAAGQAPLARAYRDAVRARSADAPGLLAALRLLDTTTGRHE